MNEISTFEGQPGHVGEAINLGIVTVSDRASSGAYEDEGGPAILGFFEAASPVRGKRIIGASPMTSKPSRLHYGNW